MTNGKTIRSLWILHILVLLSCNTPQKGESVLFTKDPPQSSAFRSEVQYLEVKDLVNQEERNEIESEISKAEELLGVPKALLWCVLFQESRFDVFKNAMTDVSAKGLGQFTSSAMEEINSDTDHFDPRTGSILNAQLSPASLPMDFRLKLKPKLKRKGNRKNALPEQFANSYFRTSTAVFASAAYLNNRYQQIKTTLDHQGIPYDSQVLWLYAAAAYNKGSRTVLLLLSHEYMSKGEGALKQLLGSSKETYKLLTHAERLDFPLRGIWTTKTRTKYVEELLRNMASISSCALSEPHV